MQENKADLWLAFVSLTEQEYFPDVYKTLKVAFLHKDGFSDILEWLFEQPLCPPYPDSQSLVTASVNSSATNVETN